MSHRLEQKIDGEWLTVSEDLKLSEAIASKVASEEENPEAEYRIEDEDESNQE